MKIKYLLSIYLIALSSCKFSDKAIIGKYSRDYAVGYYSTIEIQSNNRFKFSGQEGLIFIDSEGTWERRGNKLILNTAKHPDDLDKSKIIGESKSNSDSILINVKYELDTFPLIGATVIIKNEKESIKKFTDLYGNVKFMKSNYDSLIVKYTSAHDLRQNISTKLNTNLEIEMAQKPPIGYVNFEKEIWEIRFRKLVDKDFGTNRKERTYKKIKNKN